jgi:hypothetical protein
LQSTNVRNNERIITMQHVRLAFVNTRLLADDETKALRLRSFYAMPAQEEWRRCLYQAADILEHFGWCRSTLERGKRHCAIGAILAAYNEGDVDHTNSDIQPPAPAVKWMVGRVTRCLGQGTLAGATGIMAWNDSVAKDGKEVAALLRAAAEN